MNNNNPKHNFQVLLGFLKSGIFKTIQGKNPYLTEEQYIQFWLQLTPENTIKFVEELIKVIISMEQSQKNSIKAFLNTTNKGYAVENLLATLLVITNYKKLYIDKKKTEKDLQEIKNLWLAHSQGTKKINPCPYSSQIVNNFLQFQLKEIHEQQFISNLIGQICFLPDLTQTKLNELTQDQQLSEHFKSYFSVLDTYTKILKSENQPYYSVLIDSQIELGESCELSFAYEYLLQYINTKKQKRVIDKSIYDSIRVYFKHLPYIARDFPHEAEKAALALLHLTKQLFTFYSSQDHEAIRSVLNQVQIFRRWSYPVGPMASDLVTLLFAECKSHGNGFRQKVREEMPIVDFMENDVSSQQQQQQQKEEQKQNNYNVKQDSNYPFQKSKNNDRLQSCYVLADEESQESQYLIKHSQKLFQKNQIKNSHCLRASLIANMLSITNPEDQDFQIMGLIANLSYKNMFLIYCRLLEVLEQCEDLDSMIDIKLIQDNTFSELRKEIENINRGNNEYVDSTSVFNVMQENQQTFIPEFPVSFLTSFTKFHNTVTISKQSMRNIMPLLQQDIKWSGMPKLKEIIEDIKQENLPLHQEPLRIVVIGGDIEFHNIVQALGEIFAENPKLFLTLDYRIYLVPSKKITMATFIASQDPWYQRYLYLPFREEILAPKIEEQQEKKETKGSETGNLFGDKLGQMLLPYELKLNALHTYIREADKIYNARVYKIKCTYVKDHQQVNIGNNNNKNGMNNNNTNVNQQVEYIYFCQYLEIGVSVEAEQLKLQKKAYSKEKDQTNLYDLIDKNALKFTYHDLTLSAKTIDFVGNISEVDAPQKLSIHNLRLNNVYKEYFEGNMPYPNVNWLELAYITYENSRIFDTNLRERKIFKKFQREQLQSAFKALYTSMPIYSMQICDESNNGFDILVDGKIVSGLASIEISPHETTIEPNKNNKNTTEPKEISLKLPIVSFLPMKL